MLAFNKTILSLAFLVCCLSACGNSESQASQTIKGFYACLNNKDGACAVKYITDDYVKSAGGPNSSLGSFAKQVDQMSEIVKDVSFTIDKIVATDTSAEAVVTQTMNMKEGRPETTTATFELKKVDGRWKISNSKHGSK